MPAESDPAQGGHGRAQPFPGAAGDAFEQVPVPMAALAGPEHAIVAANAAYRALAGSAELIGQPARHVLPALAGPSVTDLLDLVYATGEPFTARDWPAAGERYFDLTLTSWRAADGGTRGVLLVQADVTERPGRSAEPFPPERPRAWLETVAVQEAMLPAGLPVLPQARIAARYLAAGGDAAGGGTPGGDWFDAFALPGGQVALLVGDVADRGVAASAAAGRLRAVLRQALDGDSDLTAALAQADRFAAGDADLQAATLALAVLRPANGQFRYATCGHPPPLVAAPDGTARHLAGTGAPPLGLQPRAESWVIAEAVLAPDEVLLLYSNGLTAGPGRTRHGGMADLEVVAGDVAASPALAARSAGTPAERVSHLTVELLTRSGYGDDVTTLAAWRPPAPLAPLDLERPVAPAAVAALRGALDDWLGALGIAYGDRQLAELSVVEAVTNAVEHAYPAARPGPVRLEAMVTADGYLETRVSDRGRWRVPDLTEAERGQGLSVAAQFAESLQVSHPPQGAGEPTGARGTVIAMRHRLHRMPMLAPLTVAPPAAGAAQTAPAFTVELGTRGGEPRIWVSGPVDLPAADRLEGRLLTACRAGVLPLTVDLSGVTLLATAGVRVLYRTAAQLAAHGRQLTLVAGPGCPAAAVLDLARLPRVPR